MNAEDQPLHRVSRRAALAAAGLAGIALASTALAQEDDGPGLGRQSHLWLPATHDDSGYFEPHDLAEQRIFGAEALSVKLGPTGLRVRADQLRQLETTPNGQAYAGQCFAASIVMGDCPIISGPRTAFGVRASFLERMVYAPLYYSGSRVEAGWGKQPQQESPYAKNVKERGEINAAEYQYIKDIHFENRVLGIRKHLVVETSDVRGKPGQQWWVYLRGFNDNNLVTTDFLSWEGLESGPSQLDFGQFPYWQATRIVLVDPSKAHPGMEQIFYNTINREIVKSFLGNTS